MRINTIAVVREFFNIKNKTQLTKATTFDGFFYSHVNHIVLNSPRGIRISPYPWRTDCCCCLWIHNLCWGASLPACLPAFLHCNCMASCVYKFLFSGSLFLLSGPSPLRLFFPWIRFSSVFLNGRLRFLEFGKVKSFFFYLFCCCCRRGRLSKLTSTTSFRATIDDNCVLVQWTQHGRYLSEWPQRFFVGHKFFFVAQLPTPMFSLQWWYHAVEEAHYRSLA